MSPTIIRPFPTPVPTLTYRQPLEVPEAQLSYLSQFIVPPSAVSEGVADGQTVTDVPWVAALIMQSPDLDAFNERFGTNWELMELGWFWCQCFQEHVGVMMGLHSDPYAVYLGGMRLTLDRSRPGLPVEVEWFFLHNRTPNMLQEMEDGESVAAAAA